MIVLMAMANFDDLPALVMATPDVAVELSFERSLAILTAMVHHAVIQSSYRSSCVSSGGVATASRHARIRLGLVEPIAGELRAGDAATTTR